MNIANVIALSEIHKDLSADRVALSKHIGSDADERRAVALQIALRDHLRRKLPSWANAQVYIPAHINLEQSSSEQAALAKQAFVQAEDTLLDLTGGMGVDFWAMSRKAKDSVYTEQNEDLFEASQYNLNKLLADLSPTLLQLDSMLHLEELLSRYKPSLIYVDPARREAGQNDKRVYALEDCSPSLSELISRVRVAALPTRILAKVSPMLDITHTLRSIPEVQALHCVSIRNEVKELLLEINPFYTQTEDKPERIASIPLRAININAQGQLSSFEGTQAKEMQAKLSSAEELGQYLYEPFGSVMKLGLFHLLAERTHTLKLHAHTHLYTSDQLHDSFPGRRFRIHEVIPYESKIIKKLYQRIPKAQITCRNFPLSADALRKKLKMTDSNEATIVATTLYDGSLVLILCVAI